MLICCVTLSSSRENQRNAQEVARGISGTVAGEIYHKSRHTKYPSETFIPRITLFAICLSFSSPPLHPCHFIRPLFLSPSLFRSSLFACLFCDCALDCLPWWLYQKVLILTLEGWKKSKTTLEVLCPCSLSIIISLEMSLKNKKVLSVS